MTEKLKRQKLLNPPEDRRVVMYCPKCGKLHLDSRWWAYKPHRKHHCLRHNCRHVWKTRRAVIGVRPNRASTGLLLGRRSRDKEGRRGDAFGC